MRSGRGGFALAYFLIVGVLIVMLVAVVLVLGREGLRATRGGVDANRALAAAEAGVALLMAEMERDPGFHGSYSETAMPDNTANYTARFAAPISAGINDSINNLTGDTPVDSYRGPGTVPRHSALLVVTGQSGTSRRVVEVLVVSGLSVLADQAITASGPIDMSGRVTVNGWKSLTDASPVPASLHSNSEDSGLRVKYSRQGVLGANIEVTGRLTSSSAEPEGVVFQVDSLPDAQLKSRVPPKALPRPNIQAMVADKSGASGAPISTAPGPRNFSGDNHYSGNVTINGDVTLAANAGLYVHGNLIVNGSILGKGKVVVTGDTTFYGEAEVAFREDDYVSLLSGGHVVLRGFKGQQYLEGLTGGSATITRPLQPDPLGLVDPRQHPNYPATVNVGIAWQNLKTAFTHLRKDVLEVTLPAPGTDLLAYQQQLRPPDADVVINDILSIISDHVAGSMGSGATGSMNRTNNSAGALRLYMEAAGGGHLSATRFLAQRMLLLEDLFRMRGTNRDGSEEPSVNVASVFTGFPELWQRTASGPFDTFQGGNDLEIGNFSQQSLDMLQAIAQFDYDRLGSANFKGIVYSGGAFVALDDVVVRGTVIVNGDPNVAPLNLELGPGVGPKTFQPGEVGLYGYSTLTYVEEMFDDGVHNLAGAGTLDIKRWIAR